MKNKKNNSFLLIDFITGAIMGGSFIFLVMSFSVNRDRIELISQCDNNIQKEKTASYNSGYRHGKLFAYEDVSVCGANAAEQADFMAYLIKEFEGAIDTADIACPLQEASIN